MANKTRGTRHLATAIVGGLSAVLLAIPMSLQLTGLAEAADAPDTAATATDWDDHPTTDQAPEDCCGVAAQFTDEAHIMLYQAGHKPDAADADSRGATRHDVVDETVDFSPDPWRWSHDSSHVKRYDDTTVDVTNNGEDNLTFSIWEDVKGWSDYWCLDSAGGWSKDGCQKITLRPGENYTATVHPNDHQGPWPHYGVAGIYLQYWES
jgi:hypothetical protein